MKLKIAGIVASAALVITGFAGPAQAAGETVTAGGASYTLKLQSACTAAYTVDKVTYASVGSGAGKSNFRSGTYDFGGTDSLYGATEVKPSNFVYIPIIGGPITLVYNLPGVTRLNLTPQNISDIYLGKITKWNDPKLVANNRTAKLPDSTIVPVYRGTTSGTSNNFANYLRQKVGGWVANDSFATASGNKLVAGSVGASNAQTLATTVKTTVGSIGYVDLADAIAENLPFAFVQNGAKQFVSPTIANAKRFFATQQLKSDGSVVWDYNQVVRGAYDVVLTSYAVASTNKGGTKAQAVKDYLDYFVNTCSQKEAAKIGYIALSGALLKKANAQIAKIK